MPARDGYLYLNRTLELDYSKYLAKNGHPKELNRTQGVKLFTYKLNNIICELLERQTLVSF